MANLAAAALGPWFTLVNAVALIGFNITARDRLHDLWERRGLPVKMGALVVTGSAITVLLNRGAGRVALASTVAFAVATVCDTVVYAALGDHPPLLKINGSNVISGVADSVIFPWVAFGTLMPWITLGQIVAKILGGFAWSLVVSRKGATYDDAG